MNSNRTPNLTLTPLRMLAACVTLTGLAALTTGCGTAIAGRTGVGSEVPAATRAMGGSVHGGQQPVSGSVIQLYQPGSGGLKSASTPLLTGTPVTSGPDGSFNIPANSYTCPSTGDQNVYLTATGGDPSFGVNSTITLVAALGPCANLSAATFVNINELTTVAAAYALQPFAADTSHVGSVNASSGLALAMTNANTLVNFSSGAAPGTTAAGVSVPTAELNTLANILAMCVNTNGASSPNCQTLYGATGASDIFSAGLAIARNPGASAITALYTLPNPSAPFQPSMSYSSQPNDFTVAIKSTGNGSLLTPYGIAINSGGFVAVTNESGSTVSLLGQSDLSSAVTYTATGLFGAQGVAFDKSGAMWVANTAGNSLIKFPSSFLIPGTAGTSYTAGGVNAPSAVAIDSANNVFAANFNGNSVTGLTTAGAALAGSPFTAGGNITNPTAIAVGPASTSGAVYVTSGTGAVVQLTNAGAFSANLNDGTLQAPSSVTVDSTGRVAATGFTTGSAVAGGLSQFTAAGAAIAGSPSVSNLNTPQGVATDGVSLFVVNSTAGGGISKYTIGSTTAVSPAAGYGSLNTPVGIAVDLTGAVITTNSGDNTVSKFIGLGTPVTTPLAASVGP